MNSARNSASSESRFRPTPPSPFALITAEGVFLRVLCMSGPCARAKGATQTAKRDNRDIPASHRGLIGLTGPPGRCKEALNPREEASIPHCQKQKKHCVINSLSRGGGSSPRRTRLRTDFPVKQGKYRENSRFRPILALLGPAITLKNNRFFFKFPKQLNREFFQRNRELNPRNRELSGGSGNRRMGPPQLRIRGPHPPLFKKPRISAAD
jgi:hypothetical protein